MIKIDSNYSKDQCKQKLLHQMDTSFGAMLSRFTIVVGQINGDQIMMHKRTPNFTNSFGRAFYGHFYASGDKTVLEGRFKLYTPVKILLIFILLIYLLMLSLIIYGLVTSPNVTAELIIGIFVMIGFGVLGGCTYAFGRYKSYEEENYLIEIIESVLANNDKEESISSQGLH